jgi:hypothetical protein
VNPERRTWDSPVRSPWNPKIHSNLQAIDLHVALYLRNGDIRHLQMAQALREYIHRLKTWIHETELKQHQNAAPESAEQSESCDA